MPDPAPKNPPGRPPRPGGPLRQSAEISPRVDCDAERAAKLRRLMAHHGLKSAVGVFYMLLDNAPDPGEPKGAISPPDPRGPGRRRR